MSKRHLPPDPLHLTPGKITEIEAELEYFEKTLLPSIRKRLAEAYEDGDMPENNPWLTANDDLQSSLKRRNELRHLLARSKTFEKQHLGAGQTGIGSKHKISINNGATKEITLVASEEADPSENKISIDSPLGKAIAVATSSKFILETPGGKVTVAIILE
jgi:transcription elongation factor GreA